MKYLCNKCRKYRPERTDSNCSTANLLHSIETLSGVSLAVIKCPNFFVDIVKSKSEEKRIMAQTEYNDRNYFV